MRLRESGFDHLGSSMQHAYAEVLPGGFESGHYYLYDPGFGFPSEGTMRPVLIFLHGSLGNFKAYMWLLKPFADEHQIAIVAPTFGLGNWNRPGGTEVVEKARQWCLNNGYDSEKIYLGCISNGGRGLTRSAGLNPDGYRGLISISGYLEEDVVDDPAFLQSWQGKPVLVLQGGEDRRVEEAQTRRSVEIMQMGGVDVDYRVHSSGDHFMMMKHSEWTLGVLSDWYQGVYP